LKKPLSGHSCPKVKRPGKTKKPQPEAAQDSY
jgi:hypothetical protein